MCDHRKLGFAWFVGQTEYNGRPQHVIKITSLTCEDCGTEFIFNTNDAGCPNLGVSKDKKEMLIGIEAIPLVLQ